MVVGGCDKSSEDKSSRTSGRGEAETTKAIGAVDREIIPVTFDDLKMSVLPKTPHKQSLREVTADLQGRRVRLAGYMFPDVVEEKMTEFVLTKDEPSRTVDYPMDAWVGVWLRDGSKTMWKAGRLSVEGKFSVEEPTDGRWPLTYHLRDAVVLPQEP
jgi:hypothetical protein